ncbi:hypothetical protein EVAR_79298_1 [Eumeta japonica]|uniref:Uncharacterized protein n=1 Tax=Eumeta variegata TaxID=151549 RepID=A0A4C1TFH1_EUMVA|nr:hypothetical protein EVAR_79298_1 [Eumeta japonica]
MSRALSHLVASLSECPARRTVSCPLGIGRREFILRITAGHLNLNAPASIQKRRSRRSFKRREIQDVLEELRIECESLITYAVFIASASVACKKSYEALPTAMEQ